jgi:hypothetical protein
VKTPSGPPPPSAAITAFCLVFPATLCLEGALGVLNVGTGLLTLGLVGAAALMAHISAGGKV